jgi:hypothetical protein
VASLIVEPDAFPFLDQIAGHDEGEILEMFERFDELMGKATSYRDGDEMAIELSWDPETESRFERWSDLAGRYMPDVECRLEGEGPSRTLHLRGPAPFLDGVAAQVERSLTG